MAASALAAFALIGANRSPADGPLQPQAGAGAVAAAPSSAANSPASPTRDALYLAIGVDPGFAQRVSQPGLVHAHRHVHAADADRHPIVRRVDRVLQPG